LEEAITALDEVISLDPEWSDAYFRRGEVHERLAEVYDPQEEAELVQLSMEAAVENYTSILEMNPENLLALEKRGVANVKIASYEAAVEDLNQVIEAGSESAELYYFRAKARHEIGEFQGAKEDVELALELDLEPDLQLEAEALLEQIEQALVPKIPGYMGVPIMPDAIDYFVLARSAGYYSNRTTAEIQNWYNQQLSAYGWYPYMDDYWCPGTDRVILTYRTSSQLAMIAVISYEGRSMVMIVVNPLGEAELDIMNAITFLCFYINPN
jgi:tetratricopeptide (TPR) repeat protein